MSALTRQQLCAELAVSESTVRRLELQGLPCTHSGRGRKFYDLPVVKAWLRSLRPEKVPEPDSAMVAAMQRFGDHVGSELKKRG